MTKQELAQKTKAKYPPYKDIDDIELADKIIAKYPVYQSQITEEKQGINPVFLICLYTLLRLSLLCLSSLSSILYVSPT